MKLETIGKLITLFAKLAQNQAAIEALKTALAPHTDEADNALLDSLILDARRQRDLAAMEAGLPIVGSPGD